MRRLVWLRRFFVKRGMRFTARALLGRKVSYEVFGAENVAGRGPVLLAARHVHHLYDGVVLTDAFNRHVHIFVALDWVQSAWTRHCMEFLCRVAEWPAALRSRGELRSYSRVDRLRYLRRAMEQATRLLVGGSLVVIFPEGAPVIDPHDVGPANDPRGIESGSIRPVLPGFCRIVEAAAEVGVTVEIVPVGFSYIAQDDRLHVVMRAGLPLRHHGFATRDATCEQLRVALERLSVT